jgi:hypothetical protein
MTTTHQFVTDNSVYEVLDHTHSPGVSVRNRTRFGKIGNEFMFAGSAYVGMYNGVYVLFVLDEDGRQVLRSSEIKSVVRITSDSAFGPNLVPLAYCEWVPPFGGPRVRSQLPRPVRDPFAGLISTASPALVAQTSVWAASEPSRTGSSATTDPRRPT